MYAHVCTYLSYLDTPQVRESKRISVTAVL